MAGIPEHVARRLGIRQAAPASDDARPPRAKGRPRREPGKMNGTERAYAAVLEARKAAGEIAIFKFEAISLRLATKCFLHPDFFVMLADGSIEFHEVKGFMQGDAAVKLRVVVDQFPMFGWKLCRKKGKQFEITDLNPI